MSDSILADDIHADSGQVHGVVMTAAPSPERGAEHLSWDDVFITTFNDDECGNCGHASWERGGCYLCIPLKEAA